MEINEYSKLAQRTISKIDYNEQLNTQNKFLLQECMRLESNLHQFIDKKQLYVMTVIRPLHPNAFGLIGEIGEFIDLIKKDIFHSKHISDEKFISELGDIMWYINACAYYMNVPLDELGSSKSIGAKELYRIKAVVYSIVDLLELDLDVILQANIDKLKSSKYYPKEGFELGKGGEDTDG